MCILRGMCNLEAESLPHDGAPAGAEPLAQALCHQQRALLVIALRGRLRAKKIVENFEILYCARNYRHSFRENKAKTLVFNDRIRAFWACFHENAGL
jgi:hypothetical protein